MASHLLQLIAFSDRNFRLINPPCCPWVFLMPCMAFLPILGEVKPNSDERESGPFIYQTSLLKRLISRRSVHHRTLRISPQIRSAIGCEYQIPSKIPTLPFGVKARQYRHVGGRARSSSFGARKLVLKYDGVHPRVEQIDGLLATPINTTNQNNNGRFFSPDYYALHAAEAALLLHFCLEFPINSYGPTQLIQT